MRQKPKSGQVRLPGQALAKICSALEYLVDRGEVDIEQVLTTVRYTRANTLPYFDVVVGGRTIRITAKDIGKAEEEEEEEAPEDAPTVKLLRASDVATVLSGPRGGAKGKR